MKREQEDYYFPRFPLIYDQSLWMSYSYRELVRLGKIGGLRIAVRCDFKNWRRDLRYRVDSLKCWVLNRTWFIWKLLRERGRR